MDKVYDPAKYENNIYSLWEKSGAFTPRVARGKSSFTIIMPPPNANDPLHIGHARFVTVEDILIRYHRMKGDITLWLPGADHAGIETQYVYEKMLAKEGKSRSDFDRETLYKNIMEYVQNNKHIMENQLRTLGATCDWTRNKFTLDPQIIKVVYKTFKKLYSEGLIYRGERIVNYCPRCGTNYSQLEVDSVERQDNLFFINYKTISVATTRPETIFADVAVCVNPKDPKYKNLIGKTAFIPLINREIPIISDPLVDINFGTGALKITPGHDQTDFEIGQKHSLSIMSVIDNHGKMTNTPEKYIGLKAEIAREEVVKDLINAKLLIKTEKINHVVGICYKDKSLIEPLVSKQWFIKVKPLAKLALDSIKDKRTKFITKKFEKIAIHWLKNLKDWNISRQIVWGIRIPAFRCEKCLEWTITEGSLPKKCLGCNHPVLSQDPDTFDTWFSSGQWPFATLKTSSPGDFEFFYPTSIMETAHDILPFWVIRMMMLGIYATGEVPFKQILIHGLIRDKEGQKISKSKGNVINPIEMSEKYGADSLRMGVIWGGLIENDISLSEDNIRGQRNFANKVWNIARYVSLEKPNRDFDQKKAKNKEDKWILKELSTTISSVTKNIDSFRLNEAIREIYEFIWHKFADVYIENTKKRRGEVQGIYQHVLFNSLKLLHPFMPFVTETVWQEMKNYQKHPSDLLISTPWPKT